MNYLINFLIPLAALFLPATDLVSANEMVDQSGPPAEQSPEFAGDQGQGGGADGTVASDPAEREALERAKIRALISPDRPLDKEMVALNEVMTDQAMEKILRDVNREALTKKRQRLEQIKQIETKQQALRDALASGNALDSTLTTLEADLANAADPASQLTVQTQLAALIAQRQQRQEEATAIQRELTQIAAQWHGLKGEEESLFEDKRTRLTTWLAEAEKARQSVTAAMAEMEAALAATGRQDRMNRLARKLRNQQIRLDKIEARLLALNDKLVQVAVDREAADNAHTGIAPGS